MRFWDILFVLLMISVLGQSRTSWAKNLGVYEFTNNSLSFSDADAADGITFSDISIGSGFGDLFDGNATRSFLRFSGNDTQNSTPDAIANQAFLTFSVTNNSGSNLVLESVEADYVATNPFNYSTGRLYSNVQGMDSLFDDTIGVYGYSTGGSLAAHDVIDLTAASGEFGANVSVFDFTVPNGSSLTFTLPWIDGSAVNTRYTDFDNLSIRAKDIGPVNVNIDASIVKSVMPDVGIGIHTSVYANNFGRATLPGAIADGGAQLLRYPGGNYASIYHWTNHTAPGGYAASQSHFGNFVTKLMEGSGAKGMVTVNYGSDFSNTMGGQPEEAAAWVAYANGDASLYGTPNDIVIGVDDAGKDWFTVGYWANLRASTPDQVPGTSMDFLAINRDDPVGITYWEVGNEVFGNGYYGDPGWQHDLHAPYDGDRKNNPALSPAAYANKFNAFVAAMKAVDPTIKIGGVLTGLGGFGDTSNPATNWDAQVLPIAGPNMDFGIIHYYVGNGTGDDTDLVLHATDNLPALFDGVRNRIENYVGPGASEDIELHMTEFGYFGTVSSAEINGVYAANTYATMLAEGLTSVHWLELSKASYLGDGIPTPGGAYYGIQLFSRIAETGAEVIQTSSSDGAIEVNSTLLPDGSVGILIANLNSSGTNVVNVIINNVALDDSGVSWLYCVTQTTPLETLLADGLGNSFSVTVPAYSIMGLKINAASRLSGDYNSNGVVDAGDYTVWRDTVGSTDDFRADGNDDAIINLEDYNIWKSLFGASLSSGSIAAYSDAHSTVVPEPATFMTAISGLLGLMLMRFVTGSCTTLRW